MADKWSEAAKAIANALEYAFVSPNVADNNLEPANIVDVLDKLARAGFALAESIDRLAATKEAP
jgi:hypothetical protein